MSTAERARVMIVDDHSIVRAGLKQVLDQSGEFEIVGQAADGEEAVKLAGEVSPDVIIMDVMMPKKDGVEACREIMEFAPETRVLMLDSINGGRRRRGGHSSRRYRVPAEGDRRRATLVSRSERGRRRTLFAGRNCQKDV